MKRLLAVLICSAPLTYAGSLDCTDDDCTVSKEKLTAMYMDRDRADQRASVAEQMVEVYKARAAQLSEGCQSITTGL